MSECRHINTIKILLSYGGKKVNGVGGGGGTIAGGGDWCVPQADQLPPMECNPTSGFGSLFRCPTSAPKGSHIRTMAIGP